LWVGGTIYMSGAGLDKVSSTTGTFVNVAVTGTGVALTVTNNVFIGGTLQVVGQSTLAGVTATNITGTTLTVSGQSILAGLTATSITGTSLTISGFSSLTGGVTASALTVTNAATVGTTLAVTGYTALNGGATISAATVTNSLTVGTTLAVTGLTTLNSTTATAFTATGITVNGTGNATSTTTGALVVTGGVGVGGNIYAGGMFSANSAVLTTATTSTLVVSSANNLNSGTSGALPYQSGVGATTFLGIGTNGYVLQSNGSTPVWAALSGLTSGLATTATNLAGGLLGYIPYQTAAGVTAYITTGTQGTILQMGANTATFASTTTIQVGYAVNLLGGTPGQLHYQSAANTTQFLSTGTQGYILVSQPGAPVFTSTSTIQVGQASYAGTATFIAGGSAGQVPFQTGNIANPTSFFGAGTAGQILVSAGASATGPVFTNTSTIQVGFSANTLGGASGNLVYQTGANATGFVTNGTSGQVLISNGSSAPSYASQSTLAVGTSTNIAGGAAGYIPMQTAPGVTSFITAGTAGQLLVSNGTTATFTNTSTIQVGYAANILGGAAGSLPYQSAANATAMLASTSTVGAILASNGSTPVYVAQVQASSTGTASASSPTGQSLVVTAGGIGVTGNSYFANQVTVASTLSNTASVSSNALYVAGGIGAAYDLTIGRNAVIAGNLTVNGQITGTNVGITVNQVTATSGVFYGDATGNGALYAGVTNYTPFGQTMFQASGNNNTYMEINVQNVNSGAKASTDIVASADNVTAANSYIDMGITSSLWDGTQPNSLGTALTPNDGYIMVGQNATAGNGDLVFGTTTTGTNFKFLAEVTATTVTNTMIAVSINRWNTPTVSTASGTLVVQGGAGFSGGVFVGGTVTSTNHIITSGVTATSTTTGALQVIGGAGIQGSLWAGNIYTNGAQILPTSIQTFTATAGQTTFAVAGGYTVGQIQVIVNGISFSSVAGDFTASNGTTVVLAAGRNTGDIVQVIASQGYAVSAQQAYSFNQYTSNGTTTTFATSYNTATVQVFQNGQLQMPTTYTANNGTSIVFGSIPANGVVVGVVSFNSVSITNAISSSGGTITGTLNVSGSLQQNGVDITTLATAMSIAMGM